MKRNYSFWPLAYGPALTFSVALQVPILVLAALTLDEGNFLRVVLIAMAAHWSAVAIIMFRRPTSPTKLDLLFVRCGILLLGLVTTFMAPVIWKLIGESTRSGWERLLGR